MRLSSRRNATVRRWVVVLVLAGGCSKEPTPALPPAAVKVPLPRSGAGSVAQVHLEAGGAVQLNGGTVKLEELSEKLRAMREQTPSVEVHLDAAADVPYERVIQALDAAHKAGIVDVSFDSAPGKPVAAPQQQH